MDSSKEEDSACLRRTALCSCYCKCPQISGASMPTFDCARIPRLFQSPCPPIQEIQRALIRKHSGKAGHAALSVSGKHWIGKPVSAFADVYRSREEKRIDDPIYPISFQRFPVRTFPKFLECMECVVLVLQVANEDLRNTEGLLLFDLLILPKILSLPSLPSDPELDINVSLS